MQRYDPRSAWWNFCAVGNYAARFYSATIVPIRALQAEFQKEMNDAVSQLEASVLKMLAKKDSSKSVVESLTDFGIYYGEKVSDRWRMLLPEMMTTYRDGLVVKNLDGDRVQLSSIGYPKDWLTAVGYFSVTPNVDGILFAPSPIPTTSDHTILLVGIVILLVAASSFFLGHRSQKLIEAVAESRDAYEMIGNKTSATESCNGHKSKSNGGYQVINEMTSLKSSYNIEI